MTDRVRTRSLRYLSFFGPARMALEPRPVSSARANGLRVTLVMDEVDDPVCSEVRMLPLTPVYLVADVSGSMSNLPLGAINAELVAIAEDLDTRTVDALRLAIVSFNSTATTVLPLSDLGDVWEMPVLQGGGGTCFSAVLEHLAHQLPDDLVSLRSHGQPVDQPVIVMLTDGRPDAGDRWETALEDLCEPGRGPSPRLLALGIGQNVGAEVLRRMVEIAGGKSCGFVARDGLPYLPVLPDLLRSIVGPLVSDIPAFRSLGP